MAESGPRLVLIPPRNLLTEEQFQLGIELCKDETTITDGTGFSNKDKWERIIDTFRIDKQHHTIFSDLDVIDILRRDQGKLCEAASHMCDLRCQWLTKMLEKFPQSAPHWHYWYVLNRQWQIPLRERARMHYLSEALKQQARLH